MSCLRLMSLAALIMACMANHALAKQYSRVVKGREVVVHTRTLPVVMHRILPPQHGRHITESEYQTGRLPDAGRNGSR